MDKGLFDALFNDNDTFFKLDGKKLNDSLEKYKGKGSASKAMFGGLELFEGKVPDNADDSAATLDSLREKDGIGGVKGFTQEEEGEGKRISAVKAGKDTYATNVQKDAPIIKEETAIGTKVTGDVKKKDTEGGKDNGDVKEGNVGSPEVVKGTKEEDVAGVTKGQEGDVKVKEEVGAEKVLGEFTDELTAKALKDKTQDSEISNYKDKDGKDVWKVTVKPKPGMMENSEALFTKAMAAYQKVVSESRKKIREEKDPLNAGLTALKSTIQNMLNFYAAGDMTQSVEYANLATKQAADIGANLQTMKAAEDAAKSVGNPTPDAGVMAPAADMPAADATGGVSADATATADSLPTGGADDVSAEEEMPAEEPAVDVEKEDEFESKKKIEGKVPTNSPDDSKETLDQLYEKKVQECAEKAYLVLKLKEKKELNEKEKAFIEAVEKEVIEDKLRADAKVFLEKMVKGDPTQKKETSKEKKAEKPEDKKQGQEIKKSEKK